MPMFRSSLLVVVSLTGSAALAQPMVPGEFYQGALRDRGSSIIFCVWPSSPMIAFDRAVGQEIAAMQFLEAEFYDVGLVSSGTQELFEQELFIHLMDDCDAAMGTSLTWQPLPEWLTITEPYYAVTYLLAATEPGISNPLALPQDARIGSIMLSQADMTFARWLAAGNRGDLSRIPYDTTNNILRAIAAGDLDAGIIPSHALPLIETDLAGQELFVTPLAAPTIEPEPVGMALLSRDTYLRERIDEAIAALHADGTIAALAELHGFAANN